MGMAVLRPDEPRLAIQRLAYGDGKARCGPGGRTDPVFAYERGFVHQLLAVGDEMVKGPAHHYPPSSAHAGYCGGVVGDIPDM